MADYAQLIANLLAKAEGTDTDAEAETFRDKAYELMTKYAIDQAVIDAKRSKDGTVREDIVKESVLMYGIYKDGLLHLSHAIVSAFTTLRGYVEKNTNMRWHDDTVKNGTKGHVYTIVGFESDVRQAKLLLESLQLQAVSALTTWWKDDTQAMIVKEVGTPMEKFKTRREFLLSFGSGAASRVRDRFKTVVAERGVGTEVMLQDRGELVASWLKENMTLGTAKGRGLARGSREAAASGYSAGRRANTGEASINTGQRSIGA